MPNSRLSVRRKSLTLNLRLHLFLHFGNRVPGIAVFLLPLGIGGDLGAELGLFGLLLDQNRRVGQRIFTADVNFQTVLQAENRAAHQARLFRPLRGKRLRGRDAALQVFSDRRPDSIALQSSSDTVSSRSVDPGWPEMKISSPGAAPLALHFRKLSVCIGLPLS